MVICLERDADLHIAQLMPLPLTVSCFSKIQIGFTFLVPAHPGSPGQRAVKRVCVCVCYLICSGHGHLCLTGCSVITIATASGVVANIYLAERMASAERESITGVCGQSPQRGPGAELLVGGQGGKAP